MTNQKYTYPWFMSCFAQARERAKNLQLSVNKNLLFQRPEPDSWSAVECIAHLNEFGNIYFDTIQQGLDNTKTGRTLNGDTFMPRFFWRGVIHIFEPPYKMKLKTISIFEPDAKNQIEDSQPFTNFYILQDRFIGQLQRCRQTGINLKDTKVSNPALTFVKMTLAECYGVAEAHQRRHLWQAEQALAQLKKAK